MSNLKIFCITNKILKKLEELNLELAGVGLEDFPNKYISSKEGLNIHHKESFYSELTFHYFFWKNFLNKFDDNLWIGFCQKRRFWLKNPIEIKNFEQLKKNLLLEIPNEWEKYQAILCDPIKVSNVKKMKIIKKGWKNLIKNPSIFFDANKQNLKLQFDMFHGYGILDKAIKVMNIKDRNDFDNYVTTKTEFSPNIMFIAKKKIMKEYFENVFRWLFDCEKIFGFENLKGYETGRLYAYLAERYLPFWFEKNCTVKFCPWAFFDTQK